LPKTTQTGDLKYLMLEQFRSSARFYLLATIVAFLSGCSDSSDTRNETRQAESARYDPSFPYSHNPQRLARFGPDSCVNCHEKAVNDWKQSHHAKANRPVSLAKDTAAFTPTRQIEESGVTYEMVQIDDTFKLRVIAADASVEEYELVGVIGETPIRQYLARLPGNKFQTISATYDVINDRWVDVFAGQDRMPDEWGHWLGQGMNWNANCAYCHTTEYEKNFDYEGNIYQSTWIQQGLACAECHSGLEEHVTASLAGDYEAGLLALDREQTEQNCVTCHSRRDQLTADAFEVGDAYHDHFSLSLPDQPGLYYADGQILDEVFVHASFEMSRMNHAGVSCMDCHNPHTLERILPVENNMLCMRCHQEGVGGSEFVAAAPSIDPLAHSFHAEGSTGNRCVECHMPQSVYMQEDWRADHGFHSPDPLMTKEFGIPNACSSCHTDQTVDWAVEHAEAWYGSKLAASPQRKRARAISKAYAYDPAALPELLELAATEVIPAWQATYAGLIGNYMPNAEAEAHLRSLLENESPMVRERATSGLAMAEDGAEVLMQKLSDESRSVRIAASRGLESRNQDVSDPRAAKEWAEYLGFNSDRPQSLFLLANQAARDSRPVDVLDRVERAIALDAANPEMYHQSAILLSSAGLNKDARRTLFAGWELAPDEPRFPYSLGLLAAEAGDLESAIGYLEETVAMAPEFYRAWYNLSLAYSRLNRPEDAARAMRKARGE
jgi:predicted CXXCH cytochrome family protein